MADVAQLGLAVDSSQVSKGKIALDQLSNSAKRAEAAASGVSSSTRNAGQAASSAASSFNAESAAATNAARALDLHARAANQNVRSLSKFNVGNLAAQWQDVAVSAQMGMSAWQIGLQQGTQVAAVVASMEKPLQGIAEALLTVLSPVSLLVIGFTTLIAAGLQMVDWAKVGAAVLRGLADAMEAIAPYAGVTAAALALMFAPALISSAYSLVAAVTSLGVAALRAAASFTVAWLAALGPAGWFFLALGAASVAIYAFRDDLAEILGFDVVDAAKRGMNTIIGVIVGGYEAAKVIWNEFPDFMGEVGEMVAWKMGSAFRSMLREMTINLNAFMKNVGEALGFENTPFIDPNKLVPEYRKEAGKLVPNYPQPTLSSGGQKAVDAASSAFDSAQGKDYVGEFGEGISRGAGAASDKLRELATQLGIVDDKTKKGRKGRGGKSDEELYGDIVKGAERRIASLKAEQAALGMTEEAALKLQYTQDLLNQAQRAGIMLTAAQKAELAGLAGQMAQIEIATEKAREAMEFNKDLVKGFVSDLQQGLENGEGFWKSFANAALNALDKVIDKLLNDVIDALFEVNKAGSGSGGGGLFGWLGSLFGGGGFKESGGGFAGLIGYASGTASARAGVAMVGERGPELVRFRGGEQVVPNHLLSGAANNNQQAPANQNVHVTIGWSRTADGNLKPFIESVSERKAGEQIAGFNQALPDRMKQINADPRKR